MPRLGFITRPPATASAPVTLQLSPDIGRDPVWRQNRIEQIAREVEAGTYHPGGGTYLTTTGGYPAAGPDPWQRFSAWAQANQRTLMIAAAAGIALVLILPSRQPRPPRRRNPRRRRR